MSVSIRTKALSALSVFFWLTVLILANFFAQTPQPSPTPSPEASPSASPTPSPVRVPSPTPTPLPGAQNFHQWGSVTVFNGLPSDSVRAISQTPDGVMWFGTDNGLARFDGRRIQNFSPGDAETNRVLALKTAPSGELYVGTQAGAFVYSDNRFQMVEGTKDVGITAIFAGREVFLGTDTGLVLRVSSDAGGMHSAVAVFPDPVLADGSPLSITSLIESEGKLIASTSGRGVFVVADGRISEFTTSPRPLFVNSIEQDDNGKLWLGADAATRFSGIYRADAGSRVSRIPASTANVLALETSDSGLWVGTERFGIFHITDSK
ncbi:MAG TPA: two-component regulator propeller domain-containing protein, partial [Pyrinomonadaceae bacterium]|nr:two-component regulator propeller domain-containing protein [Pyrinomonadaceae bacterium]